MRRKVNIHLYFLSINDIVQTKILMLNTYPKDRETPKGLKLEVELPTVHAHLTKAQPVEEDADPWFQPTGTKEKEHQHRQEA